VSLLLGAHGCQLGRLCWETVCQCIIVQTEIVREEICKQKELCVKRFKRKLDES
jgi:hypothetical protein